MLQKQAYKVNGEKNSMIRFANEKIISEIDLLKGSEMYNNIISEDIQDQFKDKMYDSRKKIN